MTVKFLSDYNYLRRLVILIFIFLTVQTSSFSQCTAPSNLSTNNEGINSATLSWVENGTSAIWDIEIGEKPFTPTGIPTIDNVSSNPYTWSGGDGGRLYEFYVRADCASGGGTGISSWAGPFEFTTLCGPDESLPYFNDFDQHINCWTIENVDNDVSGNGDVNTWKKIVTGSCGDFNNGVNSDYTLAAYYFFGSNPPPMNDWAFSPAFYLSSDTTYQLSFDYSISGASFESMKVFISDDNTPVAALSGQVLFDNDSIVGTFCSEEFQNITVSTSGLYYISFYGHTTHNQDKGLAIDDFDIREAPYCISPVQIKAEEIGTHLVDITWREVHGATSYNWEIVPAGAGQGASGAITGSIDSTRADNVGSLMDSTSYDIYVQTVCSAGTTAWSGPVNFMTHPEFCDELFYDSGGPSGNYAMNEGSTTVICPTDSGDVVIVNFLSFNTEAIDRLYVYDGPTTFDPYLGYYSGVVIPDSIISTHSSGCLTFVFGSDHSIQFSGWEAEVNCSDCRNPSSLLVTNITESGADLRWNENGSSTLWDIEIGEKPFTPTGSPTIDNVNSNPYTWTGGDGGKIYEFYVRSDCASSGNNDLSHWIGPYEFTTLCSAQESLPYSNDFDCHMNCWTIENVAGDTIPNGTENTWRRINSTSPCGNGGTDHFLSVYYTYGIHPPPMDDWVFSPAFNLSADTTYQVSFSYGNSVAGYYNFDESMEVYILDNNHSNAVGTGQKIFDESSIQSTDCLLELQHITVPSTGIYYIGFHGYSQHDEDKSLAIDDFELKEAPYCEAPINVQASDIKATTVDITWTEIFGVNSYNWEIVNSGAGQGAIGAITGIIDSIHADNVGPLTELTTYDYFVRAFCGNDTTQWSGPFSFTTKHSSDYCSDFFYDTGGPNGNYGNNEQTTTVLCPSDSGNIVTVNFLSFSTENYFDRLYVYNGSSESDPLLGNFTGTNIPEPVFSSHASGCLTFLFESDGAQTYSGWEAEVICLPCKGPDSLMATNITPSGADLNWHETGSSTVWDIEIGEVPFSPTGIPTINNVNSNSYTWTGGSENTLYEFYVRSDCAASGNEDLSNWVGPFSFTTNENFCGEYFYDSGGQSGNYVNNENTTTVICPSISGDSVTVSFLSFSTENNYDRLYAYNGPSDSDPLIGNFTGSSLPGPVVSTHSSGCLTFVFDSDGSETNAGWEAEILCSYCASPQQLVLSNITSHSSELSWIPGGDCSVDIEYWVLPGSSISPTVGSGTSISCSPVFPLYVSNLMDDQSFDVWVYEDCGSGSTAGPLKLGSFTTLIACSPPNNFTSTNITQLSADITWSPGDSCSIGEEYWLLPAPSTSPSIGTGIASSCVPSFPITVTGLSSNQEYDAWIYEDCGSGNTVGPIKLGSLTTLDACNPIDNFALDFDGVNDYVDISNIVGDNSTSIELWFNASAIIENTSLIEVRDDITYGSEFEVWFRNGGLELWNLSAWVQIVPSISAGNWYHLAISRTNATEVKTYLDGVLTSTNSINSLVNFNNQMLGKNYPPHSNHLNGHIDELRVWNGELNQSDIQSRMNSELLGTETNLVAYYKFNDGSGSSMASDLGPNSYDVALVNMDTSQDWICGKPGVAPLTCPPPSNFQANNITETNADITWSPGDSCSVGEEYWVLASPSTSPSVGNGIVTTCTTTFPIALSALSSNQEYDVWVYENCGSGNSVGPINIGSFTTLEACDPFGNFALDFDGVDNYVNISNVVGDNSTSVELWFYASTIIQDMSLIEVRDDITYGSEFEVWFRNGGIELWNLGTWVQIIPTISAGSWHHLAISRTNATEVKTYLDGVLASTNSINSTINFNNQMLGKSYPTFSNHFNGKVDELRVWDGPLSLSDIQNRMNTELLGSETNLIAYYNFNDGSGNSLASDLSLNSYDGALVNMDVSLDWICGKPGISPSCLQYYYQDLDGDGYGVNNLDSLSCTQPVGYSIENEDCDDTNPDIHPFADELCNNVDDNCDNVLDNPMVPYYNRDTMLISSTSIDSIVIPMTINGAIDPISEVRALNLDITHSRISDLEVRLESPMGTEIILFSGICENDSNLLISFQDNALVNVISCPPTSNGVFVPTGDFSDFDGENPNGTWMLTVIDNSTTHGGKINGWGLDITRDCACNIVVSTIDSLAGSIVGALNCTSPGDTIIFSSQIFGDTIDLVNFPMIINKDISILGPPFMQINISGESSLYTVDIPTISAVVLFEQLNIISGTDSNGSGIRNNGLLTLHNVQIKKHPITTTSSILLNNTPGQIIIRRGGEVIIFN